MSESISARITIGGTLLRKDLEEFLKIANETHRGDTVTEKWILQEVKNDPKSTLNLSDSEAAWGDFPDMKVFCEKHNLSYAMYADSYGEYEATMEYWTPGMVSSTGTITNANGDPVFSKKVLQGYTDNLGKFLRAIRNKVDNAPLQINAKDYARRMWAKEILHTNKIDPLHLLNMLIENVCPDPKIPPFKIV